uniref:Uncharacterized protein n=1 Tax=Arundo donax TaxID=35708 RepID=A0A0A8YHE4_ARUDO
MLCVEAAGMRYSCMGWSRPRFGIKSTFWFELNLLL